MKITHNEMQEIWNSDSQLLDELVEVTRWAILHRLVFKKDSRIWECAFREPTNEEWDDEDLDCVEVVETRETKTVYKKFLGPEWKLLGDLSPASWFKYDECLYQVYRVEEDSIQAYSTIDPRPSLQHFKKDLRVVEVLVELKILEKIDA